MSSNDVIDVMEMLKLFAKRCEEYREFEKTIERAKNECRASEQKILKLETEISDLVRQAGELNIVDLELLKHEISDLSLERSKLGFFAIKRKCVIDSLMQTKQNELQEAMRKNRLVEEITKKKQNYACCSDYEGKKQAELKTVLTEATQRKSALKTAIEKCVDSLLNIPDDILFSLLSEVGAEMAHLPNVVLKKAITKGVPAFTKEMPVQQQVKLLYQYDTPICFGGRKWNVVYVQQNKALLLLKGTYIPGAGGAYHGEGSSVVSWDRSRARKILNNDFIQSLHLKKEENILPGFDGDKVFCLSSYEVKQYLSPRQRMVEGAWWLRDTEYFRGGEYTKPHTDAYYVDMFGAIDQTLCNRSYNNYKDMQHMCFRPALWVELPYDPLDKEWNEENIDVNCKDMWTSENVYSRISISLDSLAQSQEKSSNFTDDDAWHAIVSGMMDSARFSDE